MSPLAWTKRVPVASLQLFGQNIPVYTSICYNILFSIRFSTHFISSPSYRPLTEHLLHLQISGCQVF